MRNMKPIVSIILCCHLLLFAETQAVANDGHSLKRQCGVAIAAMQGEQEADQKAITLCVGRLSGIMSLQTFYCVPEDTLLDDLMMNLYNWLDAHPSRLDENASVLIIEAFSETYPCPQQ